MLAGIIAPFLNAARFSGRIKEALEASLGRKVDFDKAYFTVFSGPGFSLENVTIAEDPRYGIEPFGYVPTLQARVRLDKLLGGEIRFTSLRLVGPSLNLVKSSDGTWNVVQLVQRLSAPRHAPLNLVPAFEVSDGRIDFKFGVRKTTLYISGSDLSIYPKRSGKVNIRFSGSPSRTDRAGVGFGHFRGDVNWSSSSSEASSNQIEGEIDLDPSNLSELTALVEGNDAGVHGTVSSKLHVQGPATALKLEGEMRLKDVHRWDLLPSSGEQWTVRYRGDLDLIAHRFDLRTVPLQSGQTTPVGLHLRVTDFLAQAPGSLVAEFKQAPLADLLPLAARMGIVLPNGAALNGALNGVIGYSSDSGWSGGLTISDASATLRGAPALHAANVNVTVSRDGVSFDPVSIQGTEQGTLQIGGTYFFSRQRTDAALNAASLPTGELKSLTTSWFGGLPALTAVHDGNISGQLAYSYSASVLDHAGSPLPASWSGQFELSDATLNVPGLATPLESSRGRVEFSDQNFSLDHFSANLGGRAVRATYRYSLLGKHTEHARVELAAADMADLEAALAPFVPADSLWARLRFRRLTVPPWLSSRDLEGDLLIHAFSVDNTALGALSTHLLWQGSDVEFSDLSLNLPQGQINGRGAVRLASSSPRWEFVAKAVRYPWGGGFVNAEGRLSAVGVHKEFLRNLKAEGSFTGEGLALSPNDTFGKIGGLFQFSFADGWPDFRFSNLQATQNGDEWNGEAASQSDGKLLVNLAHAGQQMHFVNSLTGETVSAPVSVLPKDGVVSGERPGASNSTSSTFAVRASVR